MYSHVVRQRGEAWHGIRQKAMVTGSTMNKAVGLDTVKSQNSHFDKVVHGTAEPAPKPHVIDAMRHGTETEIHAIGTLVGKVLPWLRPDYVYHETGCYLEYEKGTPFLVVSPDGESYVKGSNRVAEVYELKCPVPGNKYRPDVHYAIPRYYIPQLLCEMHATGCDTLIYLSYSACSSTVFEVTFDEDLWHTLKTVATDIYAVDKPSRPGKRNKEQYELMQKKITLFLDDHVEFVAEVPSITTNNCTHATRDNLKEEYGTHHTTDVKTELPMQDAKQTMYRCRQVHILTSVVQQYSLPCN